MGIDTDSGGLPSKIQRCSWSDLAIDQHGHAFFPNQESIYRNPDGDRAPGLHLIREFCASGTGCYSVWSGRVAPGRAAELGLTGRWKGKIDDDDAPTPGSDVPGKLPAEGRSLLLQKRIGQDLHQHLRCIAKKGEEWLGGGIYREGR